MRRFLYILLALACAASCRKPEGGDMLVRNNAFVKGADISWVTEMESYGCKFYNADGQERELTALMKELGCNAVRLRVWVNPANGWNGLDDVVKKALRAKELGMKVMIDFHYSESWADPGQQTVPSGWQRYDADEMAAAVARHTNEVLQVLKKTGVDVAWVQVGNEVTSGMLWESGRVKGTSAGQFVKYFHAGQEAVKAVYPKAQVILHLDNGWKLETLNWFLTLMKGAGLQYDLLGLSLYPSYWEDGAYTDWSPRVQDFLANLPLLHDNYGKDIMLVEFGMPFTEPAKAKAALQYLMNNTKDLPYFGGIFYWEPEAEYNQFYNHYEFGAFSDGKPTEALDPFKD